MDSPSSWKLEAFHVLQVPGLGTAGPRSAQLELGSAVIRHEHKAPRTNALRTGHIPQDSRGFFLHRSRSGGVMRIDQLPHQIVEHRIDSLAGPQLPQMPSVIPYLLAPAGIISLCSTLRA